MLLNWTDICDTSPHFSLLLAAADLVHSLSSHSLPHFALTCSPVRVPLSSSLGSFAGKLMALSTQDLSTVFPLDLAPFVWQVLVGDPVGPADLVLLDPSLGQTLELLRSNI